jgi:hypothetical protein
VWSINALFLARITVDGQTSSVHGPNTPTRSSTEVVGGPLTVGRQTVSVQVTPQPFPPGTTPPPLPWSCTLQPFLLKAQALPPSVPAPVFAAISPTQGPSVGGNGMLIAGSGFTGALEVDFGPGNPAKIAGISPDGRFLGVYVPQGTGTVDVTVTGPNGTSATSTADRYTYTG